MGIVATVLDVILAILAFVLLITLFAGGLYAAYRRHELREAIRVMDSLPHVNWPKGAHIHRYNICGTKYIDPTELGITDINKVFITDDDGNEVEIGDLLNPPEEYTVYPEPYAKV